MVETTGFFSRFQDRGLSKRQLQNGVFAGWGEVARFGVLTGAVFAAFVWIRARGLLPNTLLGNPNDLATTAEVAVFLSALWVCLLVVFAAPARWKKPLVLVSAALTVTFLLPLGVVVVLIVYGFVLYYVVHTKMPAAFKWTILLIVWLGLYFGYLGWLAPLVEKRNLEGFAIVLFAAYFLKDVYYLFEKTSVYKHRKDAHPLRDFYIFFVSTPFFFNVFHIKPIGYTYFHEKFLDRPHAKVARAGVLLFGQGVLYLLINAHLFSLWFDWPGSGSPHLITEHYATLPGWQVLLFVYYNFLKVFLILAGNVYLIVGLMRMFGFDLMADFYYPFLARNLLEHWRRWNIYNRVFVVALIFNPIVFSLGRKVNKYFTYFVACMLAFVGGLGVLIHLITTTFYVGEARFFIGIISRTILLGLATTINIWIQLWIKEKGRKKRLDAWFAKHREIGFMRHGAKMAFTFSLVGSIYFMQQGLTAGLPLSEIGRILLSIVF